jgi:hypothetical protein
MAERKGFEPSVELMTPQLLSRKPLSTTQPPLHLVVSLKHLKKARLDLETGNKRLGLRDSKAVLEISLC